MLAYADGCSSFIGPAVLCAIMLVRWAIRGSDESAEQRRERTFQPRPPPAAPPPEEEIEVDPGWDVGDDAGQPQRPSRRPYRPNPDDAW